MRQFATYLAVGLLNTGLGYAIIFFCMYVLQFSAVLSNVLGYAFGMCISYFLNRGLTFRGASTGKATAVRFGVVSISAYIANLGMLLVLIQLVGVHEGVSQLVAGGIYVMTSFLVNKYYVFQDRNMGNKVRD